MANEPHEKPCPNCGFCPTCGRSNQPPAPYYPPWWWNQPYWVRSPWPLYYVAGIKLGAQTTGQMYNQSQITGGTISFQDGTTTFEGVTFGDTPQT